MTKIGGVSPVPSRITFRIFFKDIIPKIPSEDTSRGTVLTHGPTELIENREEHPAR